MTNGESKTITYQVEIESDTPDGGYPNVAVAWVGGRPGSPSAPSLSNFAFVYTAVGVGTSFSTSIGGGEVLGATTIQEGEVLGAATGTPTGYLIFAGLLMLLGLGLLFKDRIRRKVS
jgi:LPXTG-motif cell wall-anchored protein